MITAVIILAVIALALGGFIAFDIFRDNKSVNSTTTPAANSQPSDNVAAHTAEQKRVVKQPAPPAELTTAEGNAPQAAEDEPEPEQEHEAPAEDEPQAAEQQAAEPQSLAKEEKNKIAQNISSPEAVAEIQRGDKAAEQKPAVESKALPPDEVRTEVAATEVDKIMTDEVAESLVEQSETASDRTKQGIINIDVLSQCFDSGDIVTLDEIKKRVKGFNKKTTYIKVLARGTLSKVLTVEADSFSLQAVKMIVLTGGKAIKKK